MAEITDQQLIDAGTDATNLALIVNGPATGSGSTVPTRTGPVVPTVANAVATVAATVATHFRGAYSSGTTYAIGDQVTSAGSTYISLIAGNVGNALTVTTAWALMAQAGATGAAGSSPNGVPITPTSVGIDNYVDGATPSNLLTVKDGAVDTGNQILSALLSDGSYWFPVGVRFGNSAAGSLFTGGGLVGSSTLAKDTEGYSYYTGLDTNGFTQIFRLSDTGVVLQLTAGNYNNVTPSISASGNYILFQSNRGGTYVNYQMDRAGNVQVLLGTSSWSLFSLWYVLTTGQSLAIGAYGFNAANNAVISLTQPYDNLTFNSGPRCLIGTSAAIPAGAMASAVPLTEVFPGSLTGETDASCGETITSGMLNNISAYMLQRGVHYRSFGAVNGAGGQPYSAIKQGTQVYNNGLAQCTAAKALAIAAGLTMAVPWMNIVHGEADDAAGTTSATYQADMLALLANYNTDIAAITGQTFNFPMCMSQQSSWTANASIPVGITSVAMLKVMDANLGRLFLAAPKYFFGGIYLNTVGIHLTGDGYRWLSEYYARVAAAWLYDRTIRRPLYIRRAVIIGAKVYIDYWLPTPTDQIVIDTTLVTPPTANSLGLNGWEFFDGSGSGIQINSVAVNGQSGIILTLASAPTGGVGTRHVRYAYTGTAGANGGPTTGPRGCLRTNSADVSQYGYPNMYDWAMHDDYTV